MDQPGTSGGPPVLTPEGGFNPVSFSEARHSKFFRMIHQLGLRVNIL